MELPRFLFSLLYWEAAASCCEAEVAVKTEADIFDRQCLVRFAVLMRRLLSRTVPAMLEGIAMGEDPAEFEHTVAAIAAEANELIAEARTPRPNKARAYLALGLRPKAGAEEINHTYGMLLRLWEPRSNTDKSAIEHTAYLQQAYAFLKEHGEV